MSNDIFTESISASVSCIKSYFKENDVDTSALTFLRPIAITAQNNPNGWAAKEDRTCLLDIISKKINKSIRIMEFDNDTAPDINGFVIEKEKSADIYVKKNSENTYVAGFNFCYRRFVVAKELNHLLMNAADNSLRTIDNINSFIDLVSFLTTDLPPKNDSQESEHIAYFGAMELLIPRQYFETNWFKSQDYNQTVAVQLRCPTQVIELRKNKEIKKNFLKVYKKL